MSVLRGNRVFWTGIVGLSLLAAGCGGSGSHSSTSPFAGAYLADQSIPGEGEGETPTTLLLVVGGDGKARLSIADTDNLLYTGTGAVDSAGHLHVVAEDQKGEESPPTTITFDLTLDAGTHGMTGSSSGEIVYADYSATRASVSPFSGTTYDFDYHGDSEGTGALTIGTNGKLSGSVTPDGTTTPIPISGSLDDKGNLKFKTKSGAQTITWSGSFLADPNYIYVDGEWGESPSGGDGGWYFEKHR